MARLTALYENNICVDIEIKRKNALPLKLLGTGGKNRELAILPKDFDENKHLAVFLGYGMGIAFAEFRKQFPHAPLALVDKENDILETLHFSCPEDVLFINDEDRHNAVKTLTRWQNQNQQKALYPIVNPCYQRLDKDYYGYLRDQATASQKFNFWEKAKYTKFQSSETKLLLISSKYFLMGEVESSCKNLGLKYRHIQLNNDELAHSDFVKQLLEEIISFKPDALITLNHLGVDREGVLMDLINKLELPFISWFVDNPHLILYSYEGLTSPYLHIFTWDLDNVPSLKARGFTNVYYLPLGTDATRFQPANKKKLISPSWVSAVSFVGNSMIDKVQKRLDACNLPQKFYDDFFALADCFIDSPKRIAEKFILEDGKKLFPALIQYYEEHFNTEEKLAFETGMTWEATRVYRLDCVKQILDFNPLLVGDEGWKVFLKNEKRPWRWNEPISYYDELPYFYPHSTINFNCTSMQMKGASNQRILDVPATGSFVLTDYREQMENMFDIGTEIICYNNKEEIPDLVKFYLNHDKEREEVIQKGRERVLKCHTWTHRMDEIIRTMKTFYAQN